MHFRKSRRLEDLGGEGTGQEELAKIVPCVVASDILPMGQHEGGNLLAEDKGPKFGAVMQLIKVGKYQVGGAAGSGGLKRRFEDLGVISCVED